MLSSLAGGASGAARRDCSVAGFDVHRVLIVAFLAVFWVYGSFEPNRRPPKRRRPPLVPPGFVPDPNYTWVPRTNVAPAAR